MKSLFLPVLFCGMVAAGLAAGPAVNSFSDSDPETKVSEKTAFPAESVPEKGSLTVARRLENAFLLTDKTVESVAFRTRLGRMDHAGHVLLSQVRGVDMPAGSGVPQNFTSLAIDGYTFSNEPGFPRLPVRVEMLELPQGAVPRIEYTRVAYKDIDLEKAGYPAPLYPAQLPVSKSAEKLPAFQYNADAYALDAFAAGSMPSKAGSAEDLVEVEILGEMRGTRLAKMIVKPVRYNASTHTLRVYTVLDFEIFFDEADMQATWDKKNRYFSPVFRSAERDVLNPYSIERNPGAYSGKRGDAKADLYSRPIRYVVVADPMFRDSLQKFVNWKTRFGFEMIEAYTDQPEVGNTYESIRTYLKGLYDNATETEPAPSYVLLVGDIAQIPARKYSWSFYGDHYSDLYFCEYTGDYFPDVQYGRMSATDVEELMPQIDKLIAMESITPERASFLDTSAIIAGVDSRFGNSHLNPTVDYIHSYYMKDTLERYGYKYPYPESGRKADDIIQNINDGLAVITYTAHGGNDNWSDPYISVSDINTRFTNKGKYPLAIGNACLTGKFDYGVCLGEGMLRKKDAGAVAYIGATNSTYFDHDVYWAIGYTTVLQAGKVQTYEGTELGANDALYHTHGEAYEDWALTVYEIIHAGNMAVERANQDLEEYYWEVYHVFGDPSYMPYTHRPNYPVSDHDATIVVGETSFQVQTEPYARVTLSKDGLIYGVATAGANGAAELTLSGVDEPGVIDMTVVAQNCIPLQTEVEVISPDPKYVVPSAQVLTDASGAEVKKGLYGETYTAKYTLRGVGQEAVSKVAMKIVSMDEYVTVENAEYTFEETLQPGEEKAVDHGFTIKISPNVPDNYTVKYKMELILDDMTDKIIKKEYKLSVNAPDIQIAAFTIDDAAGSKPNGVIDNGETVKGSVTLVNNSFISASDVKMRVASSENYLILPDTEFEVGLLNAGEQKTIAFEYSARDAGVYYAVYTLDFTFTSKGRETTGQVQSYIEPVIETFESGDFSFVAWDASSNWTAVDNWAHNGSFSAASATISDRDTSRLKLEVTLPMEDKVGFYYSTSTELINGILGDFLNFYIDGKRMNRWAGEDKTWKYAEYPLSAGTHTLEWAYIKDESESKGEDKVWVDDIRLPIGSHAAIGVANEDVAELGSRTSLMTVNRAGQGILTLTFHTPESLSGDLYLVNTLGQRVRNLASDLHIDGGTGTLSFGIDGLPAGMYICVFENAQGYRQTVKFVVAG